MTARHTWTSVNNTALPESLRPDDHCPPPHADPSPSADPHLPMTSTPAAGSPAAEAEAITRILSEICVPDESSPWDPPRRFSCFAHRLHLFFSQLLRSTPPEDLASTPAATTAFRGVAADLSLAAEAVAVYRTKSRIYVLIHCKQLCASLLEASTSIGAWLALLLDSPLQFPIPDLRKKGTDLAHDLQQADLKLTENEERVYCTLQREAEVRHNTKAVQSAIIMDLARALGMDSSDKAKLAEQITLLKRDVSATPSVAERRILISLEKTFDSWLAEPYAGGATPDTAFEEEAQIPPFRNFICPLTKEVMREPVTVASSAQTYERSAIKYWFDRCRDDGRDPTCPVTGQALQSLELKPNIGLSGAIEEWINRNVDLQVTAATQCFRNGVSAQSENIERSLDNAFRIDYIERSLDNMLRISEEYPSNKYKIRKAGIVQLVLQLLNDRSNILGSPVRSKALMVLYSMVKDEESKQIMLEGGVTRQAIRCLTGSTEKEKECAVKILLEYSSDEGYSAMLAKEKGALVLLSSMAGNSEYPTLSNLAEEVLKNMEKVEENVQHLAAAGRLQPLLTQLYEGTEDVKIKVASLIGATPLANNGKEYIARHGGKVLIEMLSSTQESSTSSLQALYNLSTFNDNATVLVDYGVLPALTSTFFKPHHDGSLILLELATSILANIVSKSGHWELSSTKKNEHSLSSEIVIHKLLELLSLESSKCQVAVLQIFYGIELSPQASELAASHIRSGNGIAKIIPFLEYAEMDQRIYAFRLASILSINMGQDFAEELRGSNKISLLTEKLLDSQGSVGEKSEAACILANLPLLDNEIKTILGADLLIWSISNLKEQRSSSSGRQSRRTPSMVEGLLGILLHFVKSHDPTILSIVKDNCLMPVFLDQLNIRSPPRERRRAVLGLKYLSESSRVPSVIREMEPQPPRGFCAPLVLVCGKTSMAPALCPLHSALCEDNSSFCLLKGNAVKPLIDLMNDENTHVQIAAVEALFTLVSDDQGLKNAYSELEQLGLFDAAIDMLKHVRPGELQERVMWMVERFLRVENLAQDYATDQFLVRAMAEALKHGNPNTKRYAQDALTSLRQLSGVGGKNGSRVRTRRNGH